MKFEYKPMSLESFREIANIRSNAHDQIIKSQFSLFRAQTGKNKIRILPNTWREPIGVGPYVYPIAYVYGVGPEKKSSYLSLSTMLNKPDPLEKAYRQALKDGDAELAKALKPRNQLACWVIDRNAEAEGPKVYTAPVTLIQAINSHAFDEDTKAVQDIANHNAGYDVKFEKTGTGLATEYDAAKIRIDREASPLSEDPAIQDEWMKYIIANPIPSVLNFCSYERIDEVYNGRAAAPDEDDEPRRAPKPAPIDDDEDDDAETAANSLRAKLAAKRAAG